VDAALLVAVLSGAVALASAGISWRAQVAATERSARREREFKEEERRSEAKVVLDRYRGPLLDAAWHLGIRTDNIRNRGFLAYLHATSGRALDAKLTTLFRLANYFGWREFVRTQVQLMRFANEQDTRLVAGFLDDVAHVLSSDTLDQGRAMLWADEQRGIGELMTENRSGASSPVLGHAAFHRSYDEVFAPWMERLAADLFAPTAVSSDRLRLLQWALYGLVRRLDEEDAYGADGWMERTAQELRDSGPVQGMSKAETRLRERLTAVSGG
jgi:hypothetical protein